MNEGIAALNPEFVKGFSVKIPPITALSWVVTWGICNFGAPQFVARFMSAESPKLHPRARVSQASVYYFSMFRLQSQVYAVC